MNFFKVGMPIAIQMSAEMLYFCGFAIVIGSFGAEKLAAHTIAINVCALAYLMSAGISNGATIRISSFFGGENFRKMKVAAFVATFMTVLFEVCACVVILLFKDTIPFLYLGGGEVQTRDLAAKLLVIGVLTRIVDGVQICSLGILRGLHQVKLASIICVFSYLVVGTGISYFLGVKLNYQSFGVWWGFICALSISAFLLSILCVLNLRKFTGKEEPI